MVAGAKITELCKIADALIEEKAAAIFKGKGKNGKAIMRGVAFPVCLSVNEYVCHVSPFESETTVSLPVFLLPLCAVWAVCVSPIACLPCLGVVWLMVKSSRHCSCCKLFAQGLFRPCRASASFPSLLDALWAASKLFVNCALNQVSALFAINSELLAARWPLLCRTLFVCLSGARDSTRAVRRRAFTFIGVALPSLDAVLTVSLAPRAGPLGPFSSRHGDVYLSFGRQALSAYG